MKKIIYPILLAACLILGIHIGKQFTLLKVRTNIFENELFGKDNAAGNKLSTLIDLISCQYVDTLNVDSIAELAIQPILSELDPHSVYLSGLEKQLAADDLNGSFSGIGVQFSIEEDTVMISNVISGGPCDKKGVRAGDRIVKVDGEDFTGKDINNDTVVKKLRGKKGSNVKLGIKRHGESELISFDIVRDDIKVSSIDLAYMITPTTGFVRVNKFGEKTYSEFKESLDKLRKEGADKYIIDLRDNSGGYLDQAIDMINEFLEKGQLIVYTKGRYGKEQEYANGNGEYKDVELTVLINEMSASASEIFAGAMQDNDRARIIGRRSFGKGLVQQQFPLDASSAVRLTIARYYTPSGRCIQKPYKDEKSYTDEILARYENGEMEDSTKYKHSDDETQYKTKNGRTVYGGGGITPDIFVGIDKKGVNSYYTSLNNRMLYDFCFFYSDNNRTTLQQYKTIDELSNYLDSQDLENKLADYAQTKGNIRKNSHLLTECKSLLHNNLKACIIRNFFGDEGFFIMRNKNDNIVKTALKQ